MPREINPSSPEWTEIDALMYLLNCLKNPQLFHDLSKEFADVWVEGEVRLPLEGTIMVGDLMDQIQGVIDEP